MQLQDKVIIITGGAQGLGRAMAEYMAARGAKLALVDMNQEKLDAAGFEKAYNAMVSLKGDGGRPLAIRPNVLLVPPALENAAKLLVEGDKLANGAYNPNKGKAKVIVSPWLL